MTHAGFMFPVAARCEHDDSFEDNPELCGVGVEAGRVSKAAVERIMVRSHKLQWSGWRWLYLSFGLGAWVIGGEWAALAASFALTRFFAREDRKPPA